VNRGCTKGAKFSSLPAVQNAISRGADGIPFKCGICPWWHLKKPVEHTGFTIGVRLRIRRRAGNGDVLEAVCEACGVWLGRTLGEIQHVIARGMGGTSLEVMNSAANGSLLCGAVAWQTGCHWEAEKRTAVMGAKGFYVGGSQDPRLVAMKLFDGRERYRSEDGQYLESAPALEVAA
jgi:hypothetical protein